MARTLADALLGIALPEWGPTSSHILSEKSATATARWKTIIGLHTLLSHDAGFIVPQMRCPCCSATETAGMFGRRILTGRTMATQAERIINDTREPTQSRLHLDTNDYASG